MTLYAVKTGTDQALIDLVDITPQPASNGVEYTVRDAAIDGSVSEQGKFIELRWSSLASITEYTTMLAQFGLTSVNTAEVTILVPSELYGFVRYNGLAVKPEKGRDIQRRDYFLRGIVLVVKNLTTAA